MEPSLRGKSDANECNESSLSNCRVQLALSKKRDGVIFEKILLSKDFANERNESLLSNCRVQLILFKEERGDSKVHTLQSPHNKPAV